MEDLREYLNPYLWQMELTSNAGRDEATLKVILEQHKTTESLEHVTEYLQRNIPFRVQIKTFAADEIARLGNAKLKNFIDHRDK